MILSIDVGIKNLAMCMICENTKVIHHWDVSGVPPEHQDGLYKSLRVHLDDKPWVLQATTILIEKQPDKNKRMKTVENFLQAYFVIKCPSAETIIYDARHKIPDVVGAGKAQYRKRKNTSIERCREFIKGDENSHWIPTFVASKKKDDMADTVMQALSFINRKEVPSAKPKKSAAEKVTPRKPTENQKNTKYSKANLAWFVKNKPRAELEKDKRFMKDLGRYYRTFDECLQNIKTSGSE
jgi:hypothetical protein